MTRVRLRFDKMSLKFQSPYFIQCTVCRLICDVGKINSWTCHLLDERHQRKARTECAKWRKEERECVIVCFSSVTISSAMDLLLHFSTRDFGSIVTDFVWWPGKQKMGLLQFESRSKVEEIYRALDGGELRMQDGYFWMKKGMDYVDLEWDQLILSGTIADISPIENSSEGRLQVKTNPKKPKLSPPITSNTKPSSIVRQNQESIVSSTSNLKPTSTVAKKLPEPEISSSSTQTIAAETRKTSESIESHFHRDLSKETPKTSTLFFDANENNLVPKFTAFCKSVEIPDKEYNQYLDIIKKVRNFYGPNYEVVMYRNWYLKLRNPGSWNYIAILIHFKSSSTVSKYSEDPSKTMKKIKSIIKDSQDFNSIIPGFKIQRGKSSPLKTNFGEQLYVNRSSGFGFIVNTFPLFDVEAKMCRLVEYFCTFDPCVKSLFSFIYSWATLNNICFADGKDRKSFPFTTDPATLDWLVILFLCRRGILPSPREIQKRPHQPLVARLSSFDIGFDPSPELVHEWKSRSTSLGGETDELIHHGNKKLIVRVLKLAREFFELYSYIFESGRWYLNTRDGEIYNTDKFLEPKKANFISENLPQDEFGCRKSWLLQLKQKHLQIIISHPFNPCARLPLCNKTVTEVNCGIMKKTEAQLSQLIIEVESWTSFKV